MSSQEWDEEWENRYVSQPTAARLTHLLRRYATRAQRKKLTKIINLLGDSPKTVIELGCSPGTMLNELCMLRPMHTYSGIDYAPKGLQAASRLLQSNNFKNVELILGDILTYEPKKTYDLVVSFGLIEHFDNPTEAILAHKKFTRLSGLVVCTVPNYSNRYVKKMMERYRPSDVAKHNFSIMNPEVIAKSFHMAGFSDVHSGGCTPLFLPMPKENFSWTTRLYQIMSLIWNGMAAGLPSKLAGKGWYWGSGVAHES